MYINRLDSNGLMFQGHHAAILVGNFVERDDGRDSGIEVQLQSRDYRDKTMDTITVRMAKHEARDLACRLLARCLNADLSHSATTFMENELCQLARKIVVRESARLTKQ
jgi:hypothetical protein